MKVIPKSMNSARACLKQLLHRQKVSHTGWFMGCREAFLQSLFACVLSHNSLIVSFMFSEYMLERTKDINHTSEAFLIIEALCQHFGSSYKLVSTIVNEIPAHMKSLGHMKSRHILNPSTYEIPAHMKS